jgi:hypothetical protein
MVEGALKLLKGKKLYKEFSAAAENWSSRFSIEQMGAALVNTYQRAIESASGSGEKTA